MLHYAPFGGSDSSENLASFLGPSVPNFRLLTGWQSGRGLCLCVSIPNMHSCVLLVYILCTSSYWKNHYCMAWSQVISLVICCIFTCFQFVKMWLCQITHHRLLACTHPLHVCWQVKVKSYMLGTHCTDTYSHCKNKLVVSTTERLP